MPVDMTHEELKAQLKVAQQVGEFDHIDEEAPDSYISMRLFENMDGRTFRVIDSSGMDSPFAGASDFGEWLSAEEAANWTEA